MGLRGQELCCIPLYATESKTNVIASYGSWKYLQLVLLDHANVVFIDSPASSFLRFGGFFILTHSLRDAYTLGT